jgi:gliding-associated putative ABC transporter substrate-binding component GldG
MKNSKLWSSVGILFAIIVVINMIASNIQARFDLTENNVYTMSDVTKNTLDLIEDPILVKIFYSENFPKQLITVKDYVFDLLDEYKAFAGSRLEYEFIEIGEASNDEKSDAQAIGIQPIQANIIENDQQKVQLIYFGIAFLSGDKKEVIPFANNVNQLEYLFTSSLKKLADGGKPKIAYFTGHDELSIDAPNPYNFDQSKKPDPSQKLVQKLNELFDVEKIDLSTVTEIPSHINVALWVDPKREVSEQAKFLVDQYLVRGGKLALFANNQKIDFQSPIPILPQQNGLRDFLKNYGLQLNDNIVVDKQAGRVQSMQRVGNFQMPVVIEYPFFPVFTSFNKDIGIVSRLSQLGFSFASSIDSVAGAKLRFTPLVQTSNQSGFAQKDPRRNMYNPDPKQFFDFSQKKITVAALSEGVFNSAFEAKPDTINYTGTFQKQGTLEGQVIAVGDADFLKDDMANEENLAFVMNSVDWLVDKNGLISIRSKNINIKPLDKDILADDAAGTRAFLKLLNVLLAPLLLIIFGLLRYMIKRKTKQLAQLS